VYQSTCTQSVICHVVCYAQPQKADHLLFIYLPPCFLIFPAQLLLLFWLPSTVFLLLSFLCYFLCVSAAESLKKTKTCRLGPCIVFFPLTPHTYWPLLSSYLSVFTCQRIKPLSVLFLALSGCQTLGKKAKNVPSTLWQWTYQLPFYIFKN